MPFIIAFRHSLKQALVVLPGGFNDAFSGSSSGAEGSDEGVVLAAQYEYVGVRLVQVIGGGKLPLLLPPSFIPFLLPVWQEENRPPLGAVVAGCTTGSTRRWCPFLLRGGLLRLYDVG